MFFDFNKIEDIKEDLHHQFDMVVIDPPFITREVWTKYAEISKERLNRSNAEDHYVICGDSTKISTDLSNEIKNIFKKLNCNEVDFIINSPPYWDMLNKSRGNIISAKKQHDSKGRDTNYSDNISDDFTNLFGSIS